MAYLGKNGIFDDVAPLPLNTTYIHMHKYPHTPTYLFICKIVKLRKTYFFSILKCIKTLLSSYFYVKNYHSYCNWLMKDFTEWWSCLQSVCSTRGLKVPVSWKQHTTCSSLAFFSEAQSKSSWPLRVKSSQSGVTHVLGSRSKSKVGSQSLVNYGVQLVV